MVKIFFQATLEPSNWTKYIKLSRYLILITVRSIGMFLVIAPKSLHQPFFVKLELSWRRKEWKKRFRSLGLVELSGGIVWLFHCIDIRKLLESLDYSLTLSSVLWLVQTSSITAVFDGEAQFRIEYLNLLDSLWEEDHIHCIDRVCIAFGRRRQCLL